MTSKSPLKDIGIVIATSDQHCGHQMGLCPPDGFPLVAIIEILTKGNDEQKRIEGH